jgi:hypothetical protein
MNKKVCDDILALFGDDSSLVINMDFLCENSQDLETREEAGRFFGKKWSELDPNFWCQTPASLSFLAPHAWCYYLPSLIFCSLVDLDKSAAAVENFLIDLVTRRGFEVGLGQDVELVRLGLPKLLATLGWISWLAQTGEYDEKFVVQALEKIARFVDEVSVFKGTDKM